MDHLCYFCLILCFRARLFVGALWSPAGKGLTSWLSFVMSGLLLNSFQIGNFSVLSLFCRPFLLP